jgi:hypothetical protein
MPTTTTLTTCLPPFSESCFHKTLRGKVNSNKAHHVCPTCRTRLPSKRSLRSDTSFDNIIQVFSNALKRSKVGGSNTTTTTSEKNETTPAALTTDGADTFVARDFIIAHEKKIAQFRELQKFKILKNPPPPVIRRTSSNTSSAQFNKVHSNNTISHPHRTTFLTSNNNNITSHIQQQLLEEIPAKIHLTLLLWDDSILSTETTSTTTSNNNHHSENTDNNKKRKFDAISTSTSAPTTTDLQPLPNPSLKVPTTIQIAQIKQFISAKLQLSNEILSTLEIIIPYSKDHQVC